MQTPLDTCHDLELISLRYDGGELVAEVCELALSDGRRLSKGSAAFVVRFARPVAHALTEEFPAALANWIQGSDSGFLCRVTNPSLCEALGLNIEPFEAHAAYTLITAHEVLTVFCRNEPTIEELRR